MEPTTFETTTATFFFIKSELTSPTTQSTSTTTTTSTSREPEFSKSVSMCTTKKYDKILTKFSENAVEVVNHELAVSNFEVLSHQISSLHKKGKKFGCSKEANQVNCLGPGKNLINL